MAWPGQRLWICAAQLHQVCIELLPHPREGGWHAVLRECLHAFHHYQLYDGLASIGSRHHDGLHCVTFAVCHVHEADPTRHHGHYQQWRDQKWRCPTTIEGIHGRCNHTHPVQSGYTGATGPLPRPLHMGTDEGQAKEEPSISLVLGTICNIHFSIGGNIIPTVREQAVKSLGRLYAFPLTDRHRGVEVQRTALEGLHAIEKSELPGKLKAWCFQHGLLPCLLWPLHIYEISLSRVETIQQHINKYLRKWLCVPPCFSTVGLYTTTGMLQLPSYPSQKNSRLEKLGSTWCCGTHRTTSYAKYSLKLELELSGQLLKRCKKQKPASRSKKSLEPPRLEELA